MSNAQIGQYVYAYLARIRPAVAGAVTVSYVHNWGAYPFAKDHIASCAPGDIGRCEAIFQEPVGALYFAGDHLGRIHVGLEAACESAEVAALRILDTI